VDPELIWCLLAKASFYKQAQDVFLARWRSRLPRNYSDWIEITPFPPAQAVVLSGFQQV
jgi:hypothetical protein